MAYRARELKLRCGGALWRRMTTVRGIISGGEGEGGQLANVGAEKSALLSSDAARACGGELSRDTPAELSAAVHHVVHRFWDGPRYATTRRSRRLPPRQGYSDGDTSQ